MAYATDRHLINQVQTSASALGVASTWASGRPVNVADDFLYELYVLFTVIASLLADYDVEYVPGSIHGHAFPRKPARKRGWPRFNILDKSTHAVQFQLCAGTKIRDVHGKGRGVDVSLQSATAPDNPSVGHVIQIYEAKYRTNVSRRLSHPEFSEFARWVDLFNLRHRATAGSILTGLNELDFNCLITNGDFSTEPDAECTRVAVKEARHFHPLSQPGYRP